MASTHVHVIWAQEYDQRGSTLVAAYDDEDEALAIVEQIKSCQPAMNVIVTTIPHHYRRP